MINLNNPYRIWDVIFAILDNNKRMTTLKSLNSFEQNRKIDGYVIAVSRELKLKLTEEERRECWYQIHLRVKE